MTLEQLRRIYRARPFEPFEIFLADGRSFRVNHPENMVISSGGRIFQVQVAREAEEVFDLLLVTSLKRVRST